MKHASRNSFRFANIAFVVFGALLVAIFGVTAVGTIQSLLAYGLAFTTGFFLTIAVTTGIMAGVIVRSIYTNMVVREIIGSKSLGVFVLAIYTILLVGGALAVVLL
jgi:hypothetical protein